MAKKERPDNVVYNDLTEQYDASLKPYPTNIGAPMIEVPDTVLWKNKVANKINKKVQTQFDELKKQYEKMLAEIEYNQLIFDAKFSFEPVLGEVYHLYTKNTGENFLSIIAPEQCEFEFLGSFYLNAEMMWERYISEA